MFPKGSLCKKKAQKVLVHDFKYIFFNALSTTTTKTLDKCTSMMTICLMLTAVCLINGLLMCVLITADSG